MKITTLFACVVFVASSAFDSMAQFRPVIAKQSSSTYKIHPDGSETVVGQTEGTYLRSSSGSVMSTEYHIKHGQRVGEGKSTYIDSSTGKTYLLHHEIKVARLRHVGPTPFQPPKTRPTEVVGKAVVSGVNCIAIPIRLVSEANRPIGKAWRSADAYLFVKREYTLDNFRRVWTLHDIQFAEPDPSKFSFPSNYTVDDSECAPCKEASPGAGK